MTLDDIEKLKMQYGEVQTMIEELTRQRNGERQTNAELHAKYLQALEHLQVCRKHGEALAHKLRKLEEQLIAKIGGKDD